MRYGRLVAAVAVVAGGAIAGCGNGSDGTDPTAGGPGSASVVDTMLQGVVESAPEDVRGPVRFADSDLTFGPRDSGKADGTLIVAATEVPAWAEGSGVRQVAEVARDRVVLLRSAEATRSIRDLPRRGMIARIQTSGTAGTATADAFSALAKARMTTGIQGLRSKPAPSLPAAAAAIRKGEFDGVLLTRSALRSAGRALPAGTATIPLPRSIAPDLRFQVGTVRTTGGGTSLRRWITGDAGRRALVSAGFDVPVRAERTP